MNDLDQNNPAIERLHARGARCSRMNLRLGKISPSG